MKGIVESNGPPVTSGESANFQNFLQAIGIDKDRWLKDAEASAPDIIAKTKARYLALVAYKAMLEQVKDFYSSDKKSISFANMLMELDVNIARHIQMREEDPTYSPISDREYLKAIEMKAKILDMLNKQKIDLGKLAVDVKKNGGSVTANEINWENIDE
jgi:UDP-N-acetylglucosamine pyrophosphorylase